MTELIRYPGGRNELDFSRNYGSVLTFGNFDGLHIGHQELIKCVRKEKESRSNQGEILRSACLTFYPHPAAVIEKFIRIEQILTLRSKLDILQDMDIDSLIMMRFTSDLSSMSGEEFFEKVLVETFRLRVLVVGKDAGLGKSREVDIEGVRKLCRLSGVDLIEVEERRAQNAKVSSRSIRELIKKGEVEKASKLMGRPLLFECHVQNDSGKPAIVRLLRRQIRPLSGDFSCKISLIDKGVIPGIIRFQDDVATVELLDKCPWKGRFHAFLTLENFKL